MDPQSLFEKIKDVGETEIGPNLFSRRTIVPCCATVVRPTGNSAMTGVTGTIPPGCIITTVIFVISYLTVYAKISGIAGDTAITRSRICCATTLATVMIICEDGRNRAQQGDNTKNIEYGSELFHFFTAFLCS